VPPWHHWGQRAVSDSGHNKIETNPTVTETEVQDAEGLADRTIFVGNLSLVAVHSDVVRVFVSFGLTV
jgi:hypothetical protein